MLCFWREAYERLNEMPTALPNTQLYPNPTTGLLNLDWEKEGEAKMTITDIQGRILQTNTISHGQNSIDMLNFESGLYIYQIFVEDALQYSGKIILTK